MTDEESGDAERVDVYFVVWLPPGLVVDVDLLGTRWPVPVAGAPCTLRLPRSPGDPVEREYFYDPETYLYPPDVSDLTPPADESVEAWLRVDEPRQNQQWGTTRWYTAGDEGDRVARAEVAGALVSSPYEGDDTDEARAEFFVRVGTAADAWLKVLTDWLEVLGRMVFRKPLGPARLGGLPDGWAVLSPTLQPGSSRGSAGEVRWVTRQQLSRSLSVELWTLAASLADQGRPPPLAHLFLRDARRAEWDEDLRRAVIDAATSCEVAFSKSIRARLASMPTAALDQLVDRRLNGLVALYEFHHKGLAPITTVTRKGLEDGLTKLRNRVAHAGHPPTADEAARAISVATALVNELDPLPAV